MTLAVTDVSERPMATAATSQPASISPARRLAASVMLGTVLIVAALLRLPMLGSVPNGLFLDEASRGYDAYALLLTGADQYGVRWPMFTEGIDDHTPSLYTLLVIPAVAVLGLTESAVRLPAALAGVLTVYMTYLCGVRLFGALAGLSGAAFVAISPWHILPSRTGAEWVLLPLFVATGIWLLLRGRTHGPSLLLAGATLGVGLYSYAFARLLIPLLAAGFAALYWRELTPRWRWAVSGCAVLGLLAVPLAAFSLTAAGQARLQTVVPLDRYRGLALIPYALANFASYFGPGFLIWGDEPTHHHRLAGFGPILWVMVPLLVVTFVWCARKPNSSVLFCLWWIVAAPVSAALHRESPSSALLLGAIPAWQLLAGSGFDWLTAQVRGRSPGFSTAIVGGVVAATVLTTVLVGKALYVEYPAYAAEDWLYGSREVIAYLEAHRSDYTDVVVSDRLATPHVLLLFFAQVDPATYQSAPIHVRQPAVRSRGEVGQYRFGSAESLVRQPGRHLVWVPASEVRLVAGNRQPLLTVNLPDGRPAHVVFEVETP
jgi:4-amino-4-deoxy-L-arabinose transferase-like glycosyltransferase